MNIVLELDITLLHTRPAIWRRVQVPPRLNFHELHCVVQLAMGWYNCHLYQFILGDRHEFMTLPSEFDWQTPIDSRTVLVGDYLADNGEKIAYEYDFGDGWMHEIKVRNVLDADPALSYPRLVAGERACPPEDCGGPWGFAELVEAMKKPRTKAYRELVEWLGEPFDPEAFDAEEVNRYRFKDFKKQVKDMTFL